MLYGYFYLTFELLNVGVSWYTVPTYLLVTVAFVLLSVVPWTIYNDYN